MKFSVNANSSIVYRRFVSRAPIVQTGQGLIYLASLETAWRDLLRHGFIQLDDAQKCDDARAVADEFADTLDVAPNAKPVTFAGGRFAIQRDLLGNVTLLNPQRDVPRILHDRGIGRKRNIVGYYRSVRQAVWAAVQQLAYASLYEGAYGDLDAFMYQLALSIAERPMPRRGVNRKVGAR